MFRRVAIWTVVVSLSIAALTGISVILTGDGGRLEVRVMGTTAAVGAYGIAVLCNLATLGKPYQWVGWLGLPISTLTIVIGVVLIWLPADSSVPEVWARGTWAGILTTLALAHASLIVQLVRRPQAAVRGVVGATLATIAAYAVLGLIPILADDIRLGEGYWRALWVIVILCVLGTIVSPVIGAILRGRDADSAHLTIDLPADLLERIDATGDREHAVRAALHHAFPPPPGADILPPPDHHR
ncbi:hypothetical protein GCM10010921_09800 [Microbacterium album]|uniref:Uncharacterized protein n=1 Tax=Microbacterium album TaxID=2053191 RepID=A0A917IFM7_9MICO|nr:hypothetical protein GCM10010921_09800 [Microbacterium album]